MVADLRWYWRRLRAMPAEELPHRLYRTLRFPLQYASMRAGVYARCPPQLSEWKGPRRFYFDDTLASEPLSDAERTRAERLLRGEREVLGLGWRHLPEHPWHLEPSRGGLWPTMPGERLLRSAPSGYDARLTWELNRGHDWVLLARAWRATGDAAYRTHLLNSLDSWHKANPLGVGINWASAMEASLRIHSFAWVAAFLGECPAGDLGRHIYRHAVFVERNLSEYSSANNHLIVELSGLAVASRALTGRPDISALGRLEAEARRQVYDDGVNREAATHYHAFVLEALLLVAWLERRYHQPRPGLEAVIHRMADYAEAVVAPDGFVLEHGDSDDGQIVPLWKNYALDLIAASRALSASPSVQHGADAATFVTNGIATEVTPASSSRLFARSQQVVFRSRDLIASLDAGTFGLEPLFAHAHDDPLAVRAIIGGALVLTSRGTYRYNGDSTSRRWFRSRAAQNTVQPDGLPGPVQAGPFLWRHVPTCRIDQLRLGHAVEFARASSSEGHTRTVVHYDGLLVLIDELRARTGTSRLHLPPGCEVTRTADRRFDVRTSAGPVVLTLSTAAQLVETMHSSRYADRASAPTVTYRVGPRAEAVAFGRPGVPAWSYLGEILHEFGFDPSRLAYAQ